MQVVEAVDALHSEFRAVDNLVACNTTRVLKAFQNVRVGSHVNFHSSADITSLQLSFHIILEFHTNLR